jgi:hypothetical protein
MQRAQVQLPSFNNTFYLNATLPRQCEVLSLRLFYYMLGPREGTDNEYNTKFMHCTNGTSAILRSRIFVINSERLFFIMTRVTQVEN